MGKYKPKRQRKPISATKLIVLFSAVVFIVLQVVSIVKNTKLISGTISYVELFEKLDEDEVEVVSITKSQDFCTVVLKSGETLEMVNPKSDSFIEDLQKHGANVMIQKADLTESLTSFALTLPIIILLTMMIVYLGNTVIGGSTKMFTLLKSENNQVTFDKVKGMTATKQEVRFAVDQFSNYDELESIGARPCKGILLYGPPGTGKTLLAKAIANEAGVAFISASGSDFNEVFVGVGAARVRSLYQLAMENAPCIIFIDEIDCLGKRRKGGDGASNDANQTLNSLLQRMDGLNNTNGIMVIGATNRKDDLDSALLRPGRFDRQFYIGPPATAEERNEVVRLYLENKQTTSEVTADSVGKLMIGLTGAEIEESLNEAVFISLREKRKGVIKLTDVDEAVMKILTHGVKREHTSVRDEKITAIHEAGHTIVSLLHGIQITKVSILPYSSGVGGATQRDMDKDFNYKLKFKSDLEADIRVLLAGMISEDIKYNEHTQGCSSDLDRASNIAYNMVIAFGDQKSRLFNEESIMNDGVAHLLSNEVTSECNDVLIKYKEEVRKLLQDNYDLVIKLANLLLVEKTVVQPTLDKIRALEDSDIEKTNLDREEYPYSISIVDDTEG